MAAMAQTFAEALRRAEETRDPGPLVALFDEEAELRNLAVAERGQEGARRFWQTYLDQFDHIRSRFGDLIEQDGRAALAWTSEGALKGGQPIAYRGVSILEFAGDRVRRFEATYDSAAFLRPEPAAGDPGR